MHSFRLQNGYVNAVYMTYCDHSAKFCSLVLRWPLKRDTHTQIAYTYTHSHLCISSNQQQRVACLTQTENKMSTICIFDCFLDNFGNVSCAFIDFNKYLIKHFVNLCMRICKKTPNPSAIECATIKLCVR